MVVWETEWKTDLLKHERLVKYVIEMEGQIGMDWKEEKAAGTELDK